MIEETTKIYPFIDRIRYRYFESGHKCNIKVKKQNIERRIKCDCQVYYSRQTRLWWKICLTLKNLV